MAEAAPVQNDVAPEAPALPSMQAALNQFADALFVVQDSMPEGKYIALNNAAKQLFDAKRSPPVGPLTAAASSATSQLSAVRDQLSSHLGQLHVEIDSYRDQLTSATITIDSLRDRRDQYARRLAVVESLASRLGATRKTMDTEFELYGLLPQAEFERDRKRRRSASPLAEGGEEADGEEAESNVVELDSAEESGEEEEVLLFAPGLEV